MVWPNADKSGQGEGEFIFTVFLRTLFMDGPLIFLSLFLHNFKFLSCHGLILRILHHNGVCWVRLNCI